MWPFSALSLRPITTVYRYGFNEKNIKDWKEISLGTDNPWATSISNIAILLKDQRFFKADQLWIILDNTPRRIPLHGFNIKYAQLLDECNQPKDPNISIVPDPVWFKNKRSSNKILNKKEDHIETFNEYREKYAESIATQTKSCITSTKKIYKEFYNTSPFEKAFKERCENFILEYWSFQRWKLEQPKKGDRVKFGCARSVFYIYKQMHSLKIEEVEEKYCKGVK